jgi:hypothetical protein
LVSFIVVVCGDRQYIVFSLLHIVEMCLTSLINSFMFSRWEGVLHATLAKARAINRQSNMALALLKGKPTIQWRIIM